MTNAPELVELEDDGASWAARFFPSRVQSDYAPYQLELWDFLGQIRAGRIPPIFKGRTRDAFVSIWPREHAKTSTIEMGLAYVAARRTRQFGVIVSKTLQQANERVLNVAELLTQDAFRQAYPETSSRYLSSYGFGHWSANQLQTASGFTLRAFGLNGPVRGAQDRGRRPDLIVLDDIDEQNDSAYMTAKKVDVITRAVLGAGGPGAVVVGLQNLILAGGVFDQLRTSADWLSNRYVSGPHPAVLEPRYESYLDEGRTKHRLVGGTATWRRGRGLEYAQSILDRVGLEAFKVEAQHDLRAISNLTYPTFSPERHAWRRTRFEAGRALPELPKFDLYIGGIDYGGEGEAAHHTALMVAGYLVAADTLIFLREWSENGAGVDERQRMQMYRYQEEFGRIHWRAGADQYRENSRLRREGFNVSDSDRSGPVRDQRERWVGDRLGSLQPDALGQIAPPRLYYLPGECANFALEMQRLRKRAPRFPDEPGKRDTISIHDDSVQSMEYACEEIELNHRRGVGTFAKKVTA